MNLPKKNNSSGKKEDKLNSGATAASSAAKNKLKAKVFVQDNDDSFENYDSNECSIKP